MSNYKKIVAILITVAIMLTSFPLSGFVFAHAEDFVEETNGYTRGDIIEFGSYPQSKMTDEDLIETLNALAADLTWNVTGSEESKNELEYVDVEYSGEKYRAVKFSYYKHEFSGYLDGAGNESTKNYQELNGYLIDTVYWFKFEPLKWKVLDPEIGLVLCESIIDANAFNDTIYKKDDKYYGDEECTYYANNYAESSLRQWLNEEFYNSAFSADEKVKIETTYLNNRTAAGANCSQFDCDSTYDKVFIPSLLDLIDVEYGFNQDAAFKDRARSGKAISEYALANGCSTDGISYKSYWWVRNYCGASNTSGVTINSIGVIDSGGTLYCSAVGVVPAITLNYITDSAEKISIETDKKYTDSDFIQYGSPCFYDSLFEYSQNGIMAYNHKSNTTTKLVKKDDDCPTLSNKMIEVQSNDISSPGIGGFRQVVNGYNGAEFYHVFIAKIPKDYSVKACYNKLYYDAEVEWLTSKNGTGKWEIYIVKIRYGVNPSSTGDTTCGYIYLTGEEATADKPVKWYVGYSNVFNNTGTALLSGGAFGTDNCWVYTYNNNSSASDTVSVTRVTASSDCPTLSGYMMKIQTDAGTTNPGLGGFHQEVHPEKGKVYYHKILAKVPKGYYLSDKHNKLSASFEWLTDNEGTGDWETYIYKVTVDKNATDLGTFGFVALYPDDEQNYVVSDGKWTTTQSVTWYVAYSNTFWNYEFPSDLNASGLTKAATKEYNGHIYIRYDYPVSWHMAKSLCERMGGHLATITSSDENTAVTGLLSSLTSPHYYIGGTDERTEGTWKWITGESFSYKNWSSGEPNNTNNIENYLEIVSSGLWNDLKEYNIASALNGFICEFDNDYIPLKTAEMDGHHYSLFKEPLTWTEAEAKCVAMGGHLVSINSQEEQNLIESMLPFGINDLYWIGATDSATEGDWKWVDTGETFWTGRSSGTASGYTKWNTGEPNNNNDTFEEDYAQLHNTVSRFGTWNDAPNTNSSQIGFICEFETSNIEPDYSCCYNGNKYELYNDSLTWFDAEEYAESKGGHLVTITSEQEQKFIESVIGNGNKNKNYYYIGSNNYNPTRTWEWVTKEDWSYTNWNTNQPDFDSGREYFGMILNFASTFGKWNDLENWYPSIGFIIEYEDYCSTVSFDENNGNAINYLTAPTDKNGLWTKNEDGTLKKVVSGMTITYNSNDETFNFDSNGVALAPADTSKILFSIELPKSVKQNQYLTLTAEYISGIYTKSGTSNSCIVLEASNIGYDTGAASRKYSTRCAIDIRNTEGTLTNTVYPAGPFAKDQADSIDRLYVWLYCPTGNTIVFDNYKLRLTANITDEPIEQYSYSRLSQNVKTDGTYGEKLYTPEFTNNDFVGWKYNEQIITNETKSISKTNHILTADWTLHPYILTFNANGGQCEIQSKNVYYQQPFGEMPVPTRDGYIFLGWYTKKKSGTVVKPTDIFNKSSDITLYACWGKGENSDCGENLTWALDNNKLIISGTGKMFDFDSGEAPWALVSNYITSVEIQNGVTSIGDNAFNNMSSVKSIEIADTVNELGEGSFENCLSLKEIKIPDGLKVIEENSFKNCIGISEISLPYSVIELSDGAIDGCNELKKITVYNPKCVMPEDWMTSAEDTKVYGYTNSSADSFADENDLDFVSIGFFGENDGVMWIFTTATKVLQIVGKGRMPDYQENAVPWKVIKDEVETVIFSDEISYIGNNALYNCVNVEAITFPKQLSDMGENVIEGTKWFDNCDSGIVIIKTILYAYKGGIEEDEVTLNKGVTRISKNFSTAFLNGAASPISINISNTVTDIDNKSLAYAKELKTLSVSSGNPNYKSIKNVLYSKDVTKLICYPAGLDGNISIPESVNEIGEYAFAGCSKLKSIEIGKNITNIADNAFDSTGLTKIYGYTGSYAESFAVEQGYEFIPYTSTVTLDCNDDNNTVLTITVNTGSKIGDLYVPGQDGYNFVGWYLETDDEDILVDSEYVVNEDITLYAYWDEILPEIPHITGISVISGPDKTSYFVGDTLETKGTKIAVQYSDGSIKEIDNGFYCVPSKLNRSGTQNIVVTYSGFTTDFNVTVNEVVPVSLTINSLPKTVTFFVDQHLETKGLIVTVKYNNGTQRTIKNSAEFEYVYDFSTASDASKVSVYYQENNTEVETFYQVKVLESPEVYADNISCVSGDDIVIPVKILNNTGLMGFEIIITYDPNVMTPYAPSMPNRVIYSNIETATPGELKVICCENSEITEDGVLFRLPFKINSDAAGGEYEVGISYSQDDTFNENYDNVVLVCRDSVVNVTEVQTHTIYAEDSDAISGAFVDVPIYIKNNVGIMDASYIIIKYDTSVLTYSECKGALGSVERAYEQPPGTIKIRLDELSSDELDGCLIVVRFKVSDNTSGKTELKMSIDDNRWTSKDFCLNIVGNSSESVMFADNINAKAGDSISVPVQISKNSGLMGYKVSVSYDKNQLDFIGANIADNWSDGAFVFNDNNGIVDIVWVSSDEISKDGPMFNLLFKIKNNVNSGASKLSLSYDKTSTFNGEYSPVDIVCDGCAIIIEPRITIVSATCSQTEIDYNGKYIYNISVGLNNLTEKIDTVDGYTYALEKKSDKVGTGTKVIVKEGEDIIDCYEVVLFGDVNGDGWYDVMDSIIVNCLAKGMLTVDQVGVAVFMAADCNHDGFVDETDVAILEQAGLLLSKVDQSTNTDSLIETDSAYVEYVNIIDQSIEKENDEDEEKIINDETVEKSRNMLAILFDFAKRFLNQIISFFRH